MVTPDIGVRDSSVFFHYEPKRHIYNLFLYTRSTNPYDPRRVRKYSLPIRKEKVEKKKGHKDTSDGGSVGQGVRDRVKFDP